MEKIEIIAEIGWNFLGNLSLAEKMIISAKESGASIAKFQYWNPSTLKSGSWDSDGRREIYNKAALDEKKIKYLIDICERNEIGSLFSVFTKNEAINLHKLNITDIKIPSHEVSNQDLITFCSENFKTIYFSTGASTEDEVINANDILRGGKSSYFLLHCVSSYPCNIQNANLPRINWLKDLHHQVGLSDHTQNILCPANAVAMGCKVIEKHFTTDNELEGRDNKFALNPVEFKKMVENINNTSLMMDYLGNDYQPSEEDTVKNYRGRWG